MSYLKMINSGQINLVINSKICKPEHKWLPGPEGSQLKNQILFKLSHSGVNVKRPLEDVAGLSNLAVSNFTCCEVFTQGQHEALAMA